MISACLQVSFGNFQGTERIFTALAARCDGKSIMWAIVMTSRCLRETSKGRLKRAIA